MAVASPPAKSKRNYSSARHFSPRRYTEAEYDQALEAIRTKTGSLKSILVAPLPSYKAVIQRCESDPAFRGRYREAMRSHDNPLHIKNSTVVQALELIRANPTVGVVRLLKASGLPLSRQTLNDILNRDPGLAAIAAPIRRMRKDAISFAKKQQGTPRAFAKNVLASLLAANDFYAVAERAIPRRSLDPWDRDDIKSEMIIALVDGRISVEEALRTGKQFARNFITQQRRPHFTSLDVSRYDGEPWLNSISADEWVSA